MVFFEICLYKKVCFSTGIYGYLLNYASDYAKENILKKITYKEKCTILANDFLLKNLIYKKYKIKYSKSDIITNKFGKPFFKKQIGCHFNFSHNKKYSVVVVGKEIVGVDIEDIENIKKETHRLFVSDYDYVDKNNMRLSLCKLWTAKESYCKALGCGLNVSLKDIQVIKKRNNFKIIHVEKNQKWIIKNIILSNNIVIAVCSNKSFLLKYDEINMREYILNIMSNNKSLV